MPSKLTLWIIRIGIASNDQSKRSYPPKLFRPQLPLDTEYSPAKQFHRGDDPQDERRSPRAVQHSDLLSCDRIQHAVQGGTAVDVEDLYRGSERSLKMELEDDSADIHTCGM